MPSWLHYLAIALLLLGFLSALLIVFDELRHPQHMWIMNVVWPVTALFGTAIALWGYITYGRLATHEQAKSARQGGEDPPSKKHTPFPTMVAKGTAHCGSGCALGDILDEWLAFLLPGGAVWFGWQAIFAEKMFAVWLLDYVFAFMFGIALQYFTIKPMRNLAPRQALV
jgi:hypothetical protein